MINYIECPNVPHAYDNNIKLFIAGGISNCPDWQLALRAKLEEHQSLNLTIINPRRKDFDISDKGATEFQIKWEHEQLTGADIVSFWFPKETLCPITLFELGKMAAMNKYIFVGCHPEYQRKVNVIEQLKHIRPKVEVVFSIEKLAAQIVNSWN